MKKDRGRKRTCGTCSHEAAVHTTDYRFNLVGLPVLLKRIEVIRCPHCGNIDPVIPDLNGLMHAIAFAVIGFPCRLSGEQVRFLRKYLGISADEFSELLHVDRTTLSKWENGQEIGPQSDRLIRLVVLSKSEELRGKAGELMERWNDIEDCSPRRRPQLRIDAETLKYQYA